MQPCSIERLKIPDVNGAVISKPMDESRNWAHYAMVLTAGPVHPVAQRDNFKPSTFLQALNWQEKLAYSFSYAICRN